MISKNMNASSQKNYTSVALMLWHPLSAVRHSKFECQIFMSIETVNIRLAGMGPAHLSILERYPKHRRWPD